MKSTLEKYEISEINNTINNTIKRGLNLKKNSRFLYFG